MTTAVRQGPCIVCCGTDGGFQSVEHVIPESMGNTELVLPRGVVCDRCNNGQLARLDQSLCEFPAVKMARILNGVPTKSGKHPLLRFSTGQMQRADGTLQIQLNQHDRGQTLTDERKVDGGGTLHAAMTGGPPMTPKVISCLRAALLKAALESVWLDHGEFALDPGFDHVRRAIAGVPGAGFVLVRSKMGEPTGDAGLTYELGEAGPTQRVRVNLEYFGWTCITDSRRHRPGFVPPGFLPLAFDLRS